MPSLRLPPIPDSLTTTDGTLLLGADGGVFAFPAPGRNIFHGSVVHIPLEPGVFWSQIRLPLDVGKPGGDYRVEGGNHYTIVKSNGAKFCL